MSAPLVSVIVPVYNSARFLDRCLDSVRRQSIGFDRLELIAVDDGSTDGSAEKLDAIAARHANVVVIHQENSGAPGRPRNVGTDVSRGEYLFFLDADDYLGAEALERMYDMARRNNSDIVLGRITGVGRIAPRKLFDLGNIERGDLFSTSAVYSLTAHKLFRRSLVQRYGLRFAEGVRLAEEQPFVVPAYFLADVISIVADYDCYYLVRQHGQPHLTLEVPDPASFFGIVRRVLEVVERHTEPGDRRNELLRRFAEVEICGKFRRRFPTLSTELRADFTRLASELLVDFIPVEVYADFASFDRIRLHLVRNNRVDELVALVEFEYRERRNDPVVEAGRVYARYPFFRDDRYAIPDAYYDITGELALDYCRELVRLEDGKLRIRWEPLVPSLLADDVQWVMELRGPRTQRLEFSCARCGDGVIEATLDFASAAEGLPLPHGRWQLWVTVRRDGCERSKQLGIAGALDGDLPPPVLLAGAVVTAAATGDGAVVLDSTDPPTALTAILDSVRWHGRRARLLVEARLEPTATVPPGSRLLGLVLRRNRDAVVPVAAGGPGEPLRWLVDLPRLVSETQLAAGEWTLLVTVSGDRAEAPTALETVTSDPTRISGSARLWWGAGHAYTASVRRVTRRVVVAVEGDRSAARLVARQVRPAVRSLGSRLGGPLRDHPAVSGLRPLVFRLLRVTGLEAVQLLPGAVLLERLQRTGRDEVARRRYEVRPLGTRAVAVARRKIDRVEQSERDKAMFRWLAEEHLRDLLKKYRVNCVLDVGANTGQYVEMLRRIGFAGHVVSFEPVPREFALLAAKAAADRHWTVHQLALGSEDGSLEMYVVPGTCSSALPASEYGVRRFQSLGRPDMEKVPVRRLDALLDSVLPAERSGRRLFLKLDTQGYDVEAFRGLGDRQCDVVAMQSELALLPIYAGMPRLPEALEVYEQAGFEVTGLFPVNWDGPTRRVIEYDCVLARPATL
ncbi:MAG: FkbM family methyltransferase [Mycobacteriales bacterium]